MNKPAPKYKRPDNRSLSENHVLIFMAKLSTLVKFVVVFVLLGMIPSAILIYNSDYTWNDPITFIFPAIGVILAFYVAKRVEKKHGLDTLHSRHLSSSDISELTKDKDTNKSESESTHKR